MEFSETADLVSDRQTLFGDPRPPDRRDPIQNALTRTDSNGNCGVQQKQLSPLLKKDIFPFRVGYSFN